MSVIVKHAGTDVRFVPFSRHAARPFRIMPDLNNMVSQQAVQADTPTEDA